MKKNTRKKGLAIKIISTSVTVFILCSSVLGPVSVLAENMEPNQIEETVQSDTTQTDQIEDTQESQVEANRLDRPQVNMRTTRVVNDKPFIGQQSFKYDNKSNIASLQNKAVNSGIYLTYNGKSYPFTKSLRSTNITWSTGGYIQVNYSYTFEGQTYSGYRSIDFTNTDSNSGSNPGSEEKFQIELSSNQKTIEYGTKFNPVNTFGGYVYKGSSVYSSISTYEGNYKDGVKAGTYTGNLRYVSSPSSGVSFNLTAPVTITVVRTKLDEAIQLVNDLFKDNSHSGLKETVNQNNIDTVLAQVNALPDTPEKNDLLVLLEKAKNLLNNQSFQIDLSSNQKTIEYGTKFNPVNTFGGYVYKGSSVYSSISTYEGNYKDGVKAGTYTGNLRYVSSPSSGVSFNLTAPVTITVVRIKLDEAIQLVNDLFKDNSHSELKEETNQNKIAIILGRVNALLNTPEKDDLLALLEKAKGLLSNQSIVEQAETNVNNLFGDDEHTTLAEGVTQADIDAAKEVVNQVTNAAKKEELLTEIQKAQELLDSQNQASKAVDELFKDNDPTAGIIKDGLTQEDINAAKELVELVTDPAEKAELTNEINKAQDALNEKTSDAEKEAAASKAVDELFKDNNPTAGIIKDGVTQETIDAAKELVDLVTDPAKKEALTNHINAAQEALNGKATEEANQFAAENAINGLFIDNSSETNKLKDTVKQETINSAKELLSKVTDPAKKAELQAKIDQAQKLFDATQNEVLKPVINPVGPFQQAITGTVPVGTAMVRFLVNGVAQRTAIPDAEGNFVIYSRFISDGVNKKLRLQAGDIVTIDYGVKGNPLLASNVVVNNDFIKPVVNPVAPLADYVTGIVPVGSQRIRLLVNGVAQRTASAVEDINAAVIGGIDKKTGKFKIYSRIIKDKNGVSRKLRAGDQVTIDSGVQIPGATGTTVTVE